MLPTTKEEMIKRGMTPFGVPGFEERDKKIRAKIKGTCTKRRSLSAEIRHARERAERGEESIDNITLLISNPEASARQIQEMIQTASSMSLKPSEFLQLIKIIIDKHKVFFGEKVSIDANANINVKLEDLMSSWQNNKSKKFKENGQETS